MKSSWAARSWNLIDLKHAESIPSSWNSTRPSTKMQRPASGMSMNRPARLHRDAPSLEFFSSGQFSTGQRAHSVLLRSHLEESDPVFVRLAYKFVGKEECTTANRWRGSFHNRCETQG